MAEKKIKLKDLLKGAGMEEIPKKWFDTESGDSEKGGKRSIDLILPEKEEVVLKAGTDKSDRGLVIKWQEGKGYTIYYWYEDPNKPVESELKADGTSKGKSVKKVELTYHPKED